MSSSAQVSAPQLAPGSVRLRMYLLMLVVAFFWAGNIIAGKMGLTGFDPLALAQLRVFGAALLFGICWLASGRVRRLRLPLRRWLFLAVVGATGITMNQLGFIGGMRWTNVAHTGLIVALGPAIVLAIAVAARMESLTIWKSAGMIIAFLGVAVLTSDKGGPGNANYLFGDLRVLGSIICFSTYQVLMKRVANEFDPITLNAITFSFGAILMLPFSTYSVFQTHWSTVGREAWCGLAFLIVCGSVVSYILYAYALAEMSASRAAAFSYLQPVIASSLAFWIFSERLTSSALVGGALILLGVFLTEREWGQAKSEREPAIGCPAPLED